MKGWCYSDQINQKNLSVLAAEWVNLKKDYTIENYNEVKHRIQTENGTTTVEKVAVQD